MINFFELIKFSNVILLKRSIEHCIISGFKKIVFEKEKNKFQALCLPISIPELLHKTSSEGINYLVVDCRPMSLFDAGHLPGAVHLDPETMLAGS